MEHLAAELRHAVERLTSCEMQMARLTRIVEAELASREWVRETVEAALKPVTVAISQLTGDVNELTPLIKENYAAQQQLMKERSEREQQEHAAKIAALERSSWKNVVRQAWFWVVAVIGLPVMLAGAVKALQDLAAFIKGG